MIDKLLFLPYLISFLIAAKSDLKTLTIPNSAHLLLLFTGALRVLFTPFSLGAALGALFLIALLLLIPTLILEALTKAEALGGGDIKLAASGAFALGFERSVLALAAAFFLSLLFSLFSGRGKKPLPMAPFLAAGYLLFYLTTS